MMRAYSIARQNGRTHKRNSIITPGPSRTIKEISCDTMPIYENEDTPIVPSNDDGEGPSSQQPDIDNQSHIALSIASTDGDVTEDRAGATTEIQQDVGADLNLDSFRHISPDKPEIAEATDSSESKGSDEPSAEVANEVLCNTYLAAATPLSDDSTKAIEEDQNGSSSQPELKNDQNTTPIDSQPNTRNVAATPLSDDRTKAIEEDKNSSSSQPELKNDQNTTLIDYQPNTRNVVQDEEQHIAQLDIHMASKSTSLTGAFEHKSEQQAATALAEKQHRRQVLRSVENAHQGAASCMDRQDMFDNFQQSLKQQRKRKMSIRRLSDAFTRSKDPSVTEPATIPSVPEATQDKRRLSDMLSTPKQTRQLLRKKSSMLLSRIRSSLPAAKKGAQATC